MVVRIAGQADVPLARRRSRGRGPRHAGPAPARRRAALRLMRKLLKKQGFAPKLLVTDKLRSYGAAFRRLRLTCPHEQGLQKEQSGGEFASGSATTRAQAAAVQVSSIRPALPQHACRRPQHLQPSTPPHLPIHTADLPIRGGCATCSHSGPSGGSPFRAAIPALPVARRPVW